MTNWIFTVFISLLNLLFTMYYLNFFISQLWVEVRYLYRLAIMYFIFWKVSYNSWYETPRLLFLWRRNKNFSQPKRNASISVKMCAWFCLQLFQCMQTLSALFYKKNVLVLNILPPALYNANRMNVNFGVVCIIYNCIIMVFSCKNQSWMFSAVFRSIGKNVGLFRLIKFKQKSQDFTS